jgi:hypothetical protein
MEENDEKCHFAIPSCDHSFPCFEWLWAKSISHCHPRSAHANAGTAYTDAGTAHASASAPCTDAGIAHADVCAFYANTGIAHNDASAAEKDYCRH